MTITEYSHATLPDNGFTEKLTDIVGRRYVHTAPRKTEWYRSGFRSGEGEAQAVVRPGTLLEMWRVFDACVRAGKVIIMQAANTGLTEGSTPNGSYDREVIVINTLRLDRIFLIDEGRQIVSLAGGTLYKLEKLLEPLGRQPHSVIGSSCIGASVVGGVCNNSGGMLIRRGVCYTELALYARIRGDGSLELVNHLGIDLGSTPEEILSRLERGEFGESHIDFDAGRASDDTYEGRVRDISAETPARYNADPKCLYEASGSAGKLAVFAVRLDTFATEGRERLYYIGTNDPAELTVLRQRMLTHALRLPISGEYLHRDMFDIAHKYGKDTLLIIHWLGTDYLPRFFAFKGQFDALLKRIPLLPTNLVDRALQFISRLLPEALPRRLLDFRRRFEHHLILKVENASAGEAEMFLMDVIGKDGWIECNAHEAAKAMLHRFVAAGAAVRYQAVHTKEVEGIIALDVALKRNDESWLEKLPAELEEDMVAKLYYGHFFCHVFHQDYIIRKGANTKMLKQALLATLDQRGAEYPAEHNVGHLYEAKPALRDFYQSLDPTNSMNPGIGKTSKQKTLVVGA